MTEAKGVEAVDRALEIVKSFDSEASELTLAEIAKMTGFHKSTILRLAVSLVKYGYLIRNEDGRFRLGPTMWRIGSRYRQGLDLAGIIRPELALLSAATQETASFYIRENNMRVCLFRSEPDRAIRHTIVEGSSMTIDRGASGKVLKAFSGNWDEGDETIRSQGYATSQGEREAEVAAIALPIMSSTGLLVGALSLSGLITRFSPSHEPKLLKLLHATQQKIQNQII